VANPATASAIPQPSQDEHPSACQSDLAASAFGEDAYPTIHKKAAALARIHALVDGNKRLALAASIAFYGMNGMRLMLTNDQAYELIIEVPSGALNDVPRIAFLLEAGTGSR
jgi:death on curing protein